MAQPVDLEERYAVGLFLLGQTTGALMASLTHLRDRLEHTYQANEREVLSELIDRIEDTIQRVGEFVYGRSEDPREGDMGVEGESADDR